MISASALPPASPGYPIQRMLAICGSFSANDTSRGPPPVRTRITGFLLAAATWETRAICLPGKRRLTRSRSSVSWDKSRPRMRTTKSASFAALIASSKPASESHDALWQPPHSSLAISKRSLRAQAGTPLTSFISRSDHGVLPRGLLASPPSGVPKNVNSGCPKRQPSLPNIIHRASLDPYSRCDSEPEGPVKRSHRQKDLGEAGGRRNDTAEGDTWAVGGDAVERFGPPFVGRDTKPGDGVSGIGELTNLFLKGEKRNEGVSSCGDGK
ncbi:hypothetical protein F8388_005133 [Cannabis sativa]|uniref:Uncharacterized protein n=1 Tax=Cannabis sativa TaxID=3483 RepID=A0A7J6DS62_CANSA|nr:hypothetical protein F8388_005133 [Cannabis sativa]